MPITTIALAACLAASGGEPPAVYLPNLEPKVADGFGAAVAVSGEWVFVAAPGDDVGATDSGAVHVYRWRGAGLERVDLLTAVPVFPYKHFGSAIAAAGDIVVAGSYHNSGEWLRGAVYVFRERDGVWQLEARLEQPENAPDQFGRALDTDGASVVASCGDEARVYRATDAGWVLEASGLPWSTTGDVAIDGDLLLTSALNQHTVWVHRRAADGTWVEEASWNGLALGYTASFGDAVDVSGRWALVGDSQAGVAPNTSGAGVLFERVGEGEWVERQMLLPAGAQQYDDVASAVALAGRWALLGAPQSGGAFGAGQGDGRAWLYRRDGGVWNEVGPLDPTEPGFEGALFGVAVALDAAPVLAMGAPNHDVVPTADEPTEFAGAVYAVRAGP